MTSAECEIVADAGLQLREIIASMQTLNLPTWQWADDLAMVYGKLATLPLTAEGEAA